MWKIFPKHEIKKIIVVLKTHVNKDSCFRNGVDLTGQVRLIATLQNRVFYFVTGGGNESGNQLYPIIVTYFDSDNG